MGVISLTDIQNGINFGPIPTALMIADPAYLVGNMTCDIYPEIPVIRLNILQHTDIHRLMEWVPYLRSARSPLEQNLELLRERNGELIYRVCRSIRPGEELLIWFSREYCEQIGIPRKVSSPPMVRDAEEENGRDMSYQYSCEHCEERFKFPYPFICHNMFKCRMNKSPKLTIQQSTITSSVPSYVMNRSLHDNSLLNNNNNNNKSSNIPEDTQSNLLKRKSLITAEDLSVGSAFRKVCKTTYSSKDSKESSSTCTTASSNNNNNNNNSNSLYFSTPFNPQSFANTFLHHLLPPPGGPQSAASPVPAATEHHHQGGPPQPRLPPLFNAVPKSANPMVEKLLHSAISGEVAAAGVLGTNTTAPVPTVGPLASLSMTENWCAKCNATFRMTSDLVYHMRTHHKREMGGVGSGPGDKNSGSSAVQKTKRVEQLRCEICGESFRERHHLTRHMTSHN